MDVENETQANCTTEAMPKYEKL